MTLANLTLYWVRDDMRNIDLNRHRINVGLNFVEEKTYPDAAAYALDLNDVRDLKTRLNKELVFTDKVLAYSYAARENIKVSNEILTVCEEGR